MVCYILIFTKDGYGCKQFEKKYYHDDSKGAFEFFEKFVSNYKKCTIKPLCIVRQVIQSCIVYDYLK